MSVNKVMLLGNVSTAKFHDVVVRQTQNGEKVASFVLVTSDSWKDKSSGERKYKYENHRITVWGIGLCNIIEKYVVKGTKLYIEGALETKKWQDKNGVEKYTTEVVLQGFNNKLEIVENRNGGENNDNSNDNNSTSQMADDDIPF